MTSLDVAAGLLILSVLVQIVAALLALRLNWLYGWRLAWALISVGITLMALRRGLTLYRVIVMNDSMAMSGEIEEVLTMFSASVSLLVSILIMTGVAWIGPIFREMSRAESLLRADRDGLQQMISKRDAELMSARKIQQSLLPNDCLEIERFKIAGRCWPAAETGGDYFDYFRLSSGVVVIAVADVSGHGLGPALIMAEIRAWLRTLSESEPDPGCVLRRMNDLISADTEEYFVTMFLGFVTPDTAQLVHSNAGHPAYLLDGPETVVLDVGDLPLGIQAGSFYPTSPAIDLHTGHELLLATDGLWEAASDEGEPFGIERALSTIRQHTHIEALKLLDMVYHEVCQFTRHQLQDDVTAVIIRVEPTGHEVRSNMSQVD